jgi:DNA-binding MarR family transcriptional regulator
VDGTTARQQLLAHMRDMMKAIRLFKNDLPPREMAVPPGTLGVLATVAGTTGCHVKELATACALDPSTISRAVAALVRAGLVGRMPDPDDGRASILALTDHGRDTLTTITTWYDDRLAETLRSWSTEDLVAFDGMLQRFSRDLLAQHPLESTR